VRVEGVVREWGWGRCVDCAGEGGGVGEAEGGKLVVVGE